MWRDQIAIQITSKMLVFRETCVYHTASGLELRYVPICFVNVFAYEINY